MYNRIIHSLLVHTARQCCQSTRARIQRRTGDVNAHRLDAHIINVVRFIKNDDRVFAKVSTDHFGNFGIQQVVIAVDDDIGSGKLVGHEKDKPGPTPTIA